MEFIFQIDGMTCNGCKSKVESLISAIEGVKEVHVNLQNKTATVNAERHISVNEVISALKDNPNYQVI